MDRVLENIEVRGDRAYDMRHALLYMAFPDYYERIISTRDKLWIVSTYKNQVPSALPADPDDAIQLIRAELGKRHDKPDRKFDFYSELKDEWKPGGTAPVATVTVDTDKGVVTVPGGEIEP